MSRNIGSDLNAATCLSVGISPDLFARYEKMRQSVAQADVMLHSLLNGMGLKTLDAEEVKSLLARSPGRKKGILYHIQKARQLADVRQKCLRERTGFEAQILQAARRAVIDVTDTAYARVRIRIGQEQIQVAKSLRRVRFCTDLTSKKGGIISTGF